MVVVDDRDNDLNKGRAEQDWHRTGEWRKCLEKLGIRGYWLTLGSISQSQAAGLGMRLCSNGICLWGHWE